MGVSLQQTPSDDRMLRRSRDASLAVMLCGMALLMATKLLLADAGSQSAISHRGPDPELRLELLARKDRDQSARFAGLRRIAEAQRQFGDASDETAAEETAFRAELLTLDKQNRDWLREVVTKRGWPGKSVVGVDGSDAAWLLVQHADLDPGFQRQCLTMMERLPRKEIDSRHLAFLTDRVLVNAGKRQRYGTQLHEVQGKYVIRGEVEDPNSLDARRRGAGLEPIAEYLESVQLLFKSLH